MKSFTVACYSYYYRVCCTACTCARIQNLSMSHHEYVVNIPVFDEAETFSTNEHGKKALNSLTTPCFSQICGTSYHLSYAEWLSTTHHHLQIWIIMIVRAMFPASKKCSHLIESGAVGEKNYDQGDGILSTALIHGTDRT